VRALLQEHGVVCICSSGQDTRQLLFEHDILFNNRVSLPVFLSIHKVTLSCKVTLSYHDNELLVLANKVIKITCARG